jgi:hypothetical protein
MKNLETRIQTIDKCPDLRPWWKRHPLKMLGLFLPCIFKDIADDRKCPPKCRVNIELGHLGKILISVTGKIGDYLFNK